MMEGKWKVPKQEEQRKAQSPNTKVLDFLCLGKTQVAHEHTAPPKPRAGGAFFVGAIVTDTDWSENTLQKLNFFFLLKNWPLGQ